MAYYNYSSYQPGVQDYHHQYPVSYAGNYEYVLAQSSMADYNYNNYNQYNTTPHQYTPYASSAPYHYTTEYSYSVSSYSYPNLIESHPSAYSQVYSPAESQFIISYSVSNFNEPEFMDYDPTPYGGGYDITLTYGKALPPSEEICYPRTDIGRKPQILDNSSLEATKSPPGKDEVPVSAEKPQDVIEPAKPVEEEKQEPFVESHQETSSESESEEETQESHVNETSPVSDYRNGSIGEYDTGQVPFPPPLPGSGLEAMDICESLFGYWPCLSRYQRECARRDASYGNGSCDKWQDAADYLFGGLDLYDYGQRRDCGSSYGNSLW